VIATRWGSEQAGAVWRRPYLLTNPASDDEFRRYALALLSAGVMPDSFQDALRERYPFAVVRPRLLTSEPLVVWYVYRDGHWVPSGPGAASAGHAQPANE